MASHLERATKADLLEEIASFNRDVVGDAQRCEIGGDISASEYLNQRMGDQADLIAAARRGYTRLVELQQHLRQGHVYDESGFCACGWDGNA